MPKPTRDEDGKFPAYAWPGGYQLIYYMADGGVLCPACANGENGSEASETSDDKQWRIEAVEVYYEGPTLQCDHCCCDLEAAYGDPDQSKHEQE